MEDHEGVPTNQQLDLSAAGGTSTSDAIAMDARHLQVPAVMLDEESLVAAVRAASLSNHIDLIEEIVRRHPPSAVTAQEALCRRFKGFGVERPVPEQVAAVRATVAFGGLEAKTAISGILINQVVQGPGLAAAMSACRKVGCRLPEATCLPLLHHSDPNVRADAAAFASSATEVIAVLIDLLGDLNAAISESAAMALARMNREEARPLLMRIMLTRPSAEVIDAITNIANADCIVQPGRIARTNSDLD